MDCLQTQISSALLAMAGNLSSAQATGRRTLRLRSLGPLGPAQPFTAVAGAGKNAARFSADGQSNVFGQAAGAARGRGASLRKLARDEPGLGLRAAAS